MPANTPTVSVVIPAYNTSRYIEEAIRTALGQTRPPLEVVVVDDGSEDNVAEVADACGDAVRVFRRPHRGIGAGRNFGAAQARGELLAFLDSDDLWTENKLALQLERIADESLDGCFGMVKQFYEPGLEIPEEQRTRVESRVEVGYHAGTMLVGKAAFERVGLFDEDRALGEFIDWYARAKDGGLRFAMLDDVVMMRRIHGANTVLRESSSRGDYARTLKAILDRRKRASSEKARAQSQEATS